MAIADMKEHIFENGKIEFVLENLNCHNIKFHNERDYYSASFPDGDNPQGINIRNNKYLNYRSFSRGVSYDDDKDIIDLVEYVNKCTFMEAVIYLHKLLGLEYSRTRKKKKRQDDDTSHPLYVFNKVIKAKKTANVEDIHVLDEEILNDYVPLLYIGWLREGIMPWSAKKFGLAYSYRHKRVVIPLKYWLTGELLGVNMRTTIENYRELGISKYFITPSYQKNLNLFGLYENYEAIQKARRVVVYESEKSVLKRDSINDPTGVALSGCTLSDEQVRILIGLNVEIIIALDKDVPINEVRNMCERFRNIRKVSYMYDKWGLIEDKQSPADCKNKVFEYLMKWRVPYTEEEHREYMKSLGKR